ncbi:Cytochrome P450 - like 10 [Theobroma cacao]|nr:Cytochrome P450 - like 10 [Theobroma cacao]
MEIKGVVRDGEEEVKEDDLQKMPYLKAVILEGLRRHPPGHFVLPHSVREDTVLGGFSVPKNATINFMIAEMGWDPKIWEDPMSFKPERFLSSGNKSGEVFDITGTREIKMMPFGVGRRICPGLGLAMLHLEYFVANLVWNLEWKAMDGDEVSLEEKQEFTIYMNEHDQVRRIRVALAPNRHTSNFKIFPLFIRWLNTIAQCDSSYALTSEISCTRNSALGIYSTIIHQINKQLEFPRVVTSYTLASRKPHELLQLEYLMLLNKTYFRTQVAARLVIERNSKSSNNISINIAKLLQFITTLVMTKLKAQLEAEGLAPTFELFPNEPSALSRGTVHMPCSYQIALTLPLAHQNHLLPPKKPIKRVTFEIEGTAGRSKGGGLGDIGTESSGVFGRRKPFMFLEVVAILDSPSPSQSFCLNSKFKILFLRIGSLVWNLSNPAFQ